MTMKTIQIAAESHTDSADEPSRASLPRLCIVSSGREPDSSGTMLLALMEKLPATLPCIVQIREKQLAAANLLSLSRRVKAMVNDSQSLIVLNERIDIAAAAGLAGVHLPESGCPPDKLTHLRHNMLIGKSSHSLESALDADIRGADYLIFGPVFDTPSKRRYGSPQGLDKLEAVCHAVGVPVFAIGGITTENAQRCLSAGAHGVAALSLFNDNATASGILTNLENVLYR
jgi:thiamine-phosphate pyrophosphorylase